MKKLLSSCLILLLLFTLMTGCTKEEEDVVPTPTPAPTTDQTDTTGDTTDVVTGPSYVTDEASISKVMGPEGTWIVIFTKDMTSTQDQVLEGAFKDKDGKVDRKVALYAQDADRNKTASYTLTVPKLTVRSENSRIVGGTIKGDVYVEANGFTVEDATIDGNVYFKSDEFKNSFTTTKEGKVTGTTEVQ